MLKKKRKSDEAFGSERHQNPTELRKNVKRVLEVIVGLLKDRISASEEPTNKKCHVEEIIKEKVQGAQHRFHSTSWYKDVKKLEDIVNHDQQKRCICLDSGIFLFEVWYDQNPEIVIPERIQASKSFDLL
ncbi:hypothetical protein RhiirA1_442341 [Rhizophagus irregularis]|uniref:Uncharacterized protein n=1 Tax=Rhizophagus irregularis TaxID=588596 RepID=A0A2N0RPX4_9GLOM|nr:hypothetical protein RhiirA1_442341 [Rhizophagus irregularis]